MLDLGSGPGFFINQVESSRRIAVDLDPSNKKFLDGSVEFVHTSADNLEAIGTGEVDFVFTSNLFEHLGSSEVLFETLAEIKRVLGKSKESKLMILMPNIRYVKWEFYNFIDHALPLNEVSLKEALEINGFKIEEMYKRYFPYSANDLKVKVPKIVLRIYLFLPPLLRPKAKQMLVVASPINHQ